MKTKDIKVGMKVEATKESDMYYRITNSKNGWQGIVTKINKKMDTFMAQTINCSHEKSIGKEVLGLNPKYFKPIGGEKFDEKTFISMNEVPLKVYYHRNKIYVIYKNEIVAKAVCSKDDDFNEEFGLNLALRRFCKTLCDENTTEKIVYNTDKVEDFI